MATIIDSYSETFQDSISGALATGGFTTRWAQCFTGDGQKIVDARWYAQKHTGPTGNAFAKIYAMTGTFGTSGIATGSPLATSDPVNVATLGSLALVTFSFSGANQYVTTNGVHYVVSIEFTGGDASNYLELGYDGSSATHPGNITYWDGSAWQSIGAGLDFCFYVDGVPAAVDVTVNLTGVAGSPAIGTGTVTIGSVAVTPPEAVLVAGGRRLYWLEDEEVYLEGVAASPMVGRITPLGKVTPAEVEKMFPFPQLEVPQRIGVVRRKRVFPGVVVRLPSGRGARSVVGSVEAKPFYEDIDEELIGILEAMS